MKDIESGPASSDPEALLEVAGTLFLAAFDSAHGRELWRTDGTEAGTSLVRDINPGGDSLLNYLPYPTFRSYAVAGDLLLFAAYDGSETELWKSDGTEVGTVLVKDINPDGNGSNPSKMTSFQGEAYFAADDSDHGLELWKSDGTEAGTVLVKDINPGADFSSPLELTPVGDVLFFNAVDPDHGRELWKSDGTEAGTVLVKDILPGPDSAFDDAFIWGFAAVGGDLVFFADDGEAGVEPWKSDGTEAGTSLLADLFPGHSGSFDPWGIAGTARDRRVVAGGRYFFRALQPNDGYELAVTDATPAGTQVIEINQQTSSIRLDWFGGLLGPRYLSDFNGTLLFRAGVTPNDQELWRSDGSEAGTSQVVDLLPGPTGSNPYGMKTVGGSALFATFSDGPPEVPLGSLYLTDGTEAGTEPIVEDPPIASDLVCASALGADLYFTVWGQDGFHGALWKTSGTPAGTTPIGAGPDAWYPCVVLGGTLFYSSGGELWKSDGTPAGTQPVDGLAGTSGPPLSLTVAGQLLFFSTSDDVAGREIWVSDGTEAGTHRVKDILPGPGSSIELIYEFGVFGDSPFAAVGGRVFFPADDGVAGAELWMSDGTEAGTQIVADVFPGPRSSEIRWLTAVDDRIYFVADDGVHGRELWTSDGTAGGTHLAADIFPGPGGSHPQQLAAFGSILLFSADDGLHGLEPWQAEQGVPTLLQDLAVGPTPSSPLSFTASGEFVNFAATDGLHGFEPWHLRLTSSLIFADGFERGDTKAWSFATP